MSEKRTLKHKIVTRNNKFNEKEDNSMDTIPITSQKCNLTCEERTIEKTAYKGENTMKKIITAVVTMMVMAVALTGCSNPFRTDDNHATVSITASDGRAYVFQSVNGSNATVSGKELALRYGKFTLNLKAGETAQIVFKCDACGNEQKFDISEPWSDVLACDCSEKIDKNGNAREYSAIEVSYNQKDTEEQTE